MGDSRHRRGPRLGKLEQIPTRYDYRVHLAITIGVLSLFISMASYLLLQVAVPWYTWLFPPIMIVAGNFVEYALHRWPMHRRRRHTDKFFRTHTLEHHRHFTHRAYEMESIRELYYTLPSPQVMGASIGFLVAVSALLWASLGPGPALVSALTLGLYGVVSEVLHLTFHLPEKYMSLSILRSKPYQWMIAHHRMHHDPRRMTRVNFNIGIAIFDWALGTLAPSDEIRSYASPAIRTDKHGG